MTWVIVIVIIIGYIIWKFNSDKKVVQHRNISFGGMKKLFPDFVEYFNENGFELVEDTGTKLTYKKALTYKSPFNKYLFLGVEKCFYQYSIRICNCRRW